MTKVKELIKCKHPNSRKTNALAKQIKKAQSREKNKQSRNMKQGLICEKLIWFKQHLEDCDVYSAQKTLDIIEKYLARFDAELELIKKKHSIGNRKNRQHANREDVINFTLKTDRDEFNSCGLEIPDLRNGAQLNLLKTWNCDVRFLPQFKLKRYSKNGLEKACTVSQQPFMEVEDESRNAE